jgi:TP901 family phage tail tape measure protein
MQMLQGQTNALLTTQATTLRRAEMAMVGYARQAVAAAGAFATIGTAGRAYKDFAAFERQLSRVGVILGANQTTMRRAGDDLERMAQKFALPMDQMMAGVERFASIGGRSVDEILRIMPLVATVAQASGAAVDDVANTTASLMEALKIPEAELEMAFDRMVKGAQEGRFELKDMAAEFPALAAAAAQAGYEGTEGLTSLVAILETIRDQTGTSGEAATALRDILGKMLSDEVANNFKEYGIDIREALTTAREQGLDTIGVLTKVTREAIEDGAEITRLFTDVQMRVGMIALINQYGEVQKRIDSMATSHGITRRAAERMMNDQQASLDRLSNAWGELLRTAGRFMDTIGVTTDLENLIRLLDTLGRSVEGLRTLFSDTDQAFRNLRRNFRGIFGIPEPPGLSPTERQERREDAERRFRTPSMPMTRPNMLEEEMRRQREEEERLLQRSSLGPGASQQERLLWERVIRELNRTRELRDRAGQAVIRFANTGTGEGRIWGGPGGWDGGRSLGGGGGGSAWGLGGGAGGGMGGGTGGGGTGLGGAPGAIPPASGPSGAPGTYRPQYALRPEDLSPAVINTIAGEVSTRNQAGVDAVIHNMLNRVGAKGYGPSGSIYQVARAPGQYAGYRRASAAEAEFIRSRIRAVASGSEPDITEGAMEYRASSYVYGAGAGKTFARRPGGINIGGNIYKRTGVSPGPYAAYDKPRTQVGQGPAPGRGGMGSDEAAGLRAELERPIRMNIEAPTPPQRFVPAFRRATARRMISREIRETRWNSFGDIGMA